MTSKSSSLVQTIEQAVEAHNSGDLNGAAEICRAILKSKPQDLAALHLLAVVMSDAGLNEQAVGFFESALALGGPDSAILHNYGVALQALGQLDQAARAFRHAAEAAPLRTDSWYNLGETELLRDNPAAAILAFEKVLEQNPGSTEARNNLSISLRKDGRSEDALKILQAIVTSDPKDAAVQNNLGITLTELNQFEEAKRAFQAALAVEADYADAHYNLGNVYLAEHDYEAAAECYLKNRELAPDNGSAAYHLAICRQKQKNYETALALLNQLIDAEDNLSLALGGRANVRRDMGQFDEALADFDTALALSPDDKALLGNKALTLKHAGQLAAAISTYRDALKIDPKSEQLHSNLAQALLLDGQFEEGWREFEHRLQTPSLLTKRNSLPGAEWQGEVLGGKHLLLWCEQGLGDTIQFIRYVNPVVGQAGQVTLMCPDPLVRLFQSYVSECVIVSESETPPDADFNAPLMSLPHLLQQPDIARNEAYLSAEPDLAAHWVEKLGEVEKPRIGIAWQGNPNYEADHQRSIPIGSLDPLLTLPNYQFVSLQKDLGREQLAGTAGNLIDWGDDLDRNAAFIDSAAIMTSLDLVITSDTAIPHLAGALGRPVWLMLPKTPDWRWLLGRADSPWYPGMRIFRQAAANDWPSVVDQVIEALAQESFF
tara:strand:+ start:11707 stop:13683 length:1977 start_codon:yes stop_codon:yes gene_type:complete